MVARTYDRSVVLLRRSIADDTHGDPVETWATIATVPAKKMPRRASQRFEAAEQQEAATILFRIPWSNTYADLDTTDRLTFEGRDYAIHLVDEVGRRIELEVTAVARSD